jgi:hypothetical protein
MQKFKVGDKVRLKQTFDIKRIKIFHKNEFIIKKIGWEFFDEAPFYYLEDYSWTVEENQIEKINNKIVLVLTEEEIQLLQEYLHEELDCNYSSELMKVSNKLALVKDKSFNFLHKLAEIEKEEKNYVKILTSWKYIELVNKFIQGE